MIKINIKEYSVEFVYDLLIDLLKNPFVIYADLNEKTNNLIVKFIGSEVAIRKDINYFIITNNLCQN